MKETLIEVEDGLSATEVRMLLDVTTEMARAINQKEFHAIMKIYSIAIERLLNNQQQNS